MMAFTEQRQNSGPAGWQLDSRRLFALLYLLVLFALATRATTDPDMWWHLRTGEAIWAGGIPRQDIFSFTASHHSWVTHEWLTQLLLWGIYLVGGLPLLMVVFALIHALTFLLVYQISPGRPYLAGFVGLLALVAAAPLMGVRPQMLTLFFMALFLFLVEKVKDGRYPPRIFWLLPILTVVWVNLHSGYLLGVVLLAVYILGEGLQRWRQPVARTLVWPAIRQLAAVTVACFLAVVVNPNGAEIWIYPFQTLGSAAMQTYIVEWHSPNFQHLHFWPFLVLVGLGLFAWWHSPQKATWSEMLLFGGTAVAGLISARHIPLFAVAAAPVVARHLFYATAAYPRLHGTLTGATRRRPTRGQALLNSLILLAAVLVAFVWVADRVLTNEAAIAETYPVAAVDYLYETGLADQPGFNSYGWGGYLIWRQIPVFIDGRADVYGDDFIFYYLRTYFGHERWREALDETAVSYVLVERGGVLVSLLLDAPEWELVYEDELARIFYRP